VEGDYIIPKRKYSGFFATGLDLLLRELGVRKLILTGIVTDICVLHTAADAYMLGYEIVILKDCVAALSKEDQQFALERMERLYNAQIL
jgi:nicotinamidase-related amidase